MVYRLIAENPLWDGHGCTVSSTCYTCEFNNPPWFCKQLPKPTTEDMRYEYACGYVQGNFLLEDEDTPVQLIFF